jgi:hypothetical protein
MTPEQRAARERKQKIFVAVGGVFLLVLLAIQLPKILGGSSGSEAASETTPAATTPATTPATTRPTPSPPSSPAAGLGGAVSFSSSEQAKLRAFTVFSRKDPFVQQVVTPSGSSSGSASGTSSKGETKPSEEKTPSQEFATGPKASVTVIRVNGVPEPVTPGAAFPSADPVFVLVAEQPRKKTVTIGIAGGAYASGQKTIALAVGKAVVLENTATGATYRLVLVSVGNGVGAPASKGSSQAPPPEGAGTP